MYKSPEHPFRCFCCCFVSFFVSFFVDLLLLLLLLFSFVSSSPFYLVLLFLPARPRCCCVFLFSCLYCASNDNDETYVILMFQKSL